MDSTTGSPSHLSASCSNFSSAANALAHTMPSYKQLHITGPVCEHSPEPLYPAPYTTGSTITAWRHQPPAPFGLGYSTVPPAQHSDPATLSHEELCTLRQPLEGHTQYKYQKTFRVSFPIRTGSGRGPQIVVLNSDLVAKIYDPLYYESDGYTDVLWRADQDYSREAAAYEHLQRSDRVSDIVPAFYGTWTFDVSTKTVQDGVLVIKSRSVRMILMEHLQGQCMAAINAYEISEPARESILRLCLDAEIRLYHAGVTHGDFCPRNIIIEGSSSSPSEVRVKIIDFNVSIVIEHPSYKYPSNLGKRERFSKKWSGRLTSPIVRFFGNMLAFLCEGWCPSGNREAEKWLWRNYAHDDRYATVKWNQDDEFDRPAYTEPTEKPDAPCFERDSVITLQSWPETKVSSSSSNARSPSNGK